MTLGTALRGENENLSSSAVVLRKTSNLATSCCCFADDGKEMDKKRKTQVQSVQSYWSVCPLNMQICDIRFVVAVVVAKTPYY